MRDWVKPFLINGHKNELDEQGMDQDEKKWSTEHFLKELESNEKIWWDLADELNIHFGFGGLGGPETWFMSAFGSVLSDLPKEIFLKLREMKNVFYTFTPNPGAEVKHFIFEEDYDIQNWDQIIVVTFPYDTHFRPEIAARVGIAHEFVHVCVHSDKVASNDAMENEADRIAVDWGFEEEIKVMREYEKEYYETKSEE